jgi:hypothetical protein
LEAVDSEEKRAGRRVVVDILHPLDQWQQTYSRRQHRQQQEGQHARNVNSYMQIGAMEFV